MKWWQVYQLRLNRKKLNSMKNVIKLVKSIAVAFSIYSRIPMPSFDWDSDDMKYQLIFFPWVGGVIGLAVWLWTYVCEYQQINKLTWGLIMLAIPLIITGGLHIDGFMDTSDARHSYQPKERKLEILKDPHIGAFSVICLLIYVLIYLAALLLVDAKAAYALIACFFFASRALSGIAIKTFKQAKSEGMVKTTADNSEGKIVVPVLIIELIMCLTFMAVISIRGLLAILVVESAVFIYYKKMSYKEFGGVTGDLAGYYVSIAELTCVLTMAICNIAGIL